MYRVWAFLTSYVWTLCAGAALGLILANLSPGAYAYLTAFPLAFGDTVGQDAGIWLAEHGARFDIPDLGDVTRVLTVSEAVATFGMALVLVLAAKELWEALILDHGALRGRAALLPGAMALGGLGGAALLYLALNAALDLDAAAGWAIPGTTDIAIAYVLGRAVFGSGDPALRLLLVMAVADDALAMAILAVFHPQFTPQPQWLAVAALAGLAAYLLANLLPRIIDGADPMKPAQTATRLRLGLLPYAVTGAVSIFAVTRSGLHPALGLLPVLPALPHADRAFGVFASAEKHLHDLLNRAEQMLRYPVGVVLFLFAFCQAGVPLGAAGPLSLVVMAAMLIGKPLGTLAGGLAARLVDARVPWSRIRRVAMVSGAGFTMALLLSDAAALSPEQSRAARIGVLGGVIALAALGAVLRRRPQSFT